MAILLQEYPSMEKCVQVFNESKTKRNFEENDKGSYVKKLDKQWTKC
nr:hypothetical protein [Holospora elegans]